MGDVLEVKLEKGKITLTPQSLIDRHLEEGLEDISKGRTYGPFDTADDMMRPCVVTLGTDPKQKDPSVSDEAGLY